MRACMSMKDDLVKTSRSIHNNNKKKLVGHVSFTKAAQPGRSGAAAAGREALLCVCLDGDGSHLSPRAVPSRPVPSASGGMSDEWIMRNRSCAAIWKRTATAQFSAVRHK